MVRKILISGYIILFCFLNVKLNCQVLAKSDTLTETLELKSKIFNNERALRILLPPGYYDSSKKNERYSVLYLNDGFSVFKKWEIKQTIYGLIDSGIIQPLIVVGIDNAINNVKTNPDFRTNEYLPYPEETEPTVPNPQGKLYPDFLINEVLPLINSKYRTLTSKNNTGIGGSSYGGYVSLYTYLKKPGIFGRVLLESTPFFISKGKLIEDVQKFKQWNGRIVIGVGTKETNDEEINKKGFEAQKAIADVINKHVNKVRLKLVVSPSTSHNAKAWASRLPEDIKFLFGK